MSVLIPPLTTPAPPTSGAVTQRGWIQSASAPGVRFRRHPRGRWTVVEAEGEIDLAAAPTMRRLLLWASPGDIVIDLTRVHFMDVSGLNVLIESWTRSRVQRTQLRVVVPPGQVLKLLEITGYDDLLPCVVTLDQVSA